MTRVSWSYAVVLVLVLLSMSSLTSADQRNGANKGRINELSDVKEWKKLIKTKTNVLVFFVTGPRPSPAFTQTIKVLQEAADAVRGIGTIVYADCSTGDGKKLCKKVKVGVDGSSTGTGGAGGVFKHYHNGDFNRDYDRALKVASIVNFMKDPTGDLPWDEDPTATNVVHLQNLQALLKLVKKESTSRVGILVMFYAPWCGFCKKMKPDYVQAAEELKAGNEGILAAIDVNRPENSAVSKKYNITGFPTILYFRGGSMKQQYEGENTKDGIVSFMRNPDAPPVQKPKEANWADEPSQVVHLTVDTFDQFIKDHPSVLVMFYAPWCGHCKRMKPAFTAAAEQLKELKIDGFLAAVDATAESELGRRFEVKGYPTIKYFKSGELAFDVAEARDEASLVKFMRDPTEPPPPPPPEASWAEEPDSPVVHLNVENFKPTLKRKKHALVMFYAPWCGHCKQVKPEFIAAAEELKDDPKVLFGAVDCTVHRELCTTYDVKGYPTFKHFQYFNKEEVTTYNGERTKNDFANEVGSNVQAPSRHSYPDWNGHAGSEYVHKLTDETLTDFLKTRESVLVMFYAPWCGHCKTMKGDYAKAANSLARDAPSAALAAIDCVQYPRVMERFRIQGYPTLKYYRFGSYIGEYNESRRAADFIAFMLRAPKSRDEL